MNTIKPIQVSEANGTAACGAWSYGEGRAAGAAERLDGGRSPLGSASVPRLEVDCAQRRTALDMASVCCLTVIIHWGSRGLLSRS